MSLGLAGLCNMRWLVGGLEGCQPAQLARRVRMRADSASGSGSAGIMDTSVPKVSSLLVIRRSALPSSWPPITAQTCRANAIVLLLTEHWHCVASR